MTQPAHDDRALARIEAELRHSDPEFLALFDWLGGTGTREPRRAVAPRPRRLGVALLLLAAVLTAVLVWGQATGWLGRPASAGAVIIGLPGRAAAVAQARLHDWQQETRALVCGSFPAGWGSACG